MSCLWEAENDLREEEINIVTCYICLDCNPQKSAEEKNQQLLRPGEEQERGSVYVGETSS